MAYTQFYKVSPNSLVVDTAAYTASDVVGGLLTFDLTGLSQNGGILNSVLLTDAANQSEPYYLYLFNELPSTIADQAAFAPTIADLKKVFAIVNIAAADYLTPNSLGIALKEDINNVFVTANNRIYGYLVANASTPDYTATTDLGLTLYILAE